jgi:hypothetical protein
MNFPKLPGVIVNRVDNGLSARRFVRPGAHVHALPPEVSLRVHIYVGAARRSVDQTRSLPPMEKVPPRARPMLSLRQKSFPPRAPDPIPEHYLPATCSRPLSSNLSIPDSAPRTESAEPSPRIISVRTVSDAFPFTLPGRLCREHALADCDFPTQQTWAEGR